MASTARHEPDLAHPLITHKISLMRRLDCRMSKFNDLLHETGAWFGFALTRDVELVEDDIKRFPDGKQIKSKFIENKRIAIVPILRSGLVLAEGFRSVVRSVRVGHMGFTRIEETGTIEPYLIALPALKGRTFIILDASIGTGRTAMRAIDVMHDEYGIAYDKIKIAAVLAAPEGLDALARRYPDVRIHFAHLEEGLEPKTGYIYPGIGDVSSRVFGYYEIVEDD